MESVRDTVSIGGKFRQQLEASVNYGGGMGKEGDIVYTRKEVKTT